MAGAPDKSLSLHIVTSTDGAGLQQAETGLSGVSAAVGAVSATLSSAADQADRFTLSMTRAAQAGGGAGASAVPLPAPVPGGSGTTTGPVPAPAPAPAPVPGGAGTGPPVLRTEVDNRYPDRYRVVRNIHGPAPAPTPAPAPAAAPDPVPAPTAPDTSVPTSPSGAEASPAPAAGDAQAAADAGQKLNDSLDKTNASAAKAKEAMAAFKASTDAAAASSAAGGEAASSAGEASTEAAEASAEGADAAAESTEASSEGAEEQEEATGSLTEHVEKLVDATKDKAEATDNAADADDKGKEKAKQMGQAALGAARFIDDMQYGMKGVVNNIPDVVEKFGMGAGMAGVLGILGVVIETVITKFDVFGAEAKKLAAEQAKLAKSLRDAVISADAEKESIDAAEAALKEHEDAVDAAADAYSNLTEEIGRTQAAREALNRAILAETDADLALRLTQIAQDKEDGLITEADAIKQSAAAKRAADATKFQTEDDSASKEMGEMSGKAKELDRDAQVQTRRIEFLRREGSGGLLDAEGAKQINARIDQVLAQAAELRTEMEKQPEEAELSRQTIVSTTGVPVAIPTMGPNPEREKIRAKLKQTYEKQRELMDQKEAHEAATKYTGYSDADAFNKDLEDAEKEEKKLRENAAAIRAEINAKADLQTRNRRTYQTNVKVSEGTEKLDVTKVMNQEAEQVKREADRDLQKKREKENEADSEQMRKLKEQGVDTTKAQQELAERRRKERRAEDERREKEEKDEKQKRLKPPDPIGPTQKDPGPWEGPTKSGMYPQQAPGPVIVGTPNERKHAMDNFGMTAKDREAEARLSDQQARDRAASRAGGSGDQAAVKSAADALGRSAGDNASASASLMTEMVGILQRQQRQIDNQTRQMKTLESQIREGRTGR